MRTLAKFTEGPWKMTGEEGRYISDNNDVIVAALQIPNDDGQRAVANAALIASAPELYRCLHAVCETMGKLSAISDDPELKQLFFKIFSDVGDVLKRAQGEE